MKHYFSSVENGWGGGGGNSHYCGTTEVQWAATTDKEEAG